MHNPTLQQYPVTSEMQAELVRLVDFVARRRPGQKAYDYYVSLEMIGRPDVFVISPEELLTLRLGKGRSESVRQSDR